MLKNTVLAVAVLVAGYLPATTHAQETPVPFTCGTFTTGNPIDCVITVKLKSSGGPCAFWVDREVTVFKKRSTPNAQITMTWKLDQGSLADYKFLSLGPFNLKKPAQLRGAIFHTPTVSNRGKQFTLLNENPRREDYAYSLLIIPPASTGENLCTFDPTIANQGLDPGFVGNKKTKAK